MTHTFYDLGLNANLLDTLEQLSYQVPTPIQAQAIPVILAGQDVMGQAQTGTGKTAAFTLPILQQLDGDGLQCLILTPTRELAGQVSQAVHRYGAANGVRVLPIYGGTSYERQTRRLKRGVHVVVGTPGRTLDLVNQGALDLSGVRFMVFDEADEMLKMGFIEDVEAILRMTPKETRQTLLFSATFSPQIVRLAQQYMRNPQQITVEAEQLTADNIEQRYYLLNESDKIAALSRILETEPHENVLVFTRTRVGSAELAQNLSERGYGAVAIHGDLAQNERERILHRFRVGQLNVLVATDVVGRGMDIPNVSHVVNYDVPQLPIEYVHRIGRTGRAGRSGVALTFVTRKQMHTLKRIESTIETSITRTQPPTLEAVRQARSHNLKAELTAHVQAVGPEDDFTLVDELMNEGYSPEQIVAGMLRMIREQRADAPMDHINPVKEAPGRQRDRREKRPQRERGERGRKGGKYDDSNMVRLTLNVGRSSGVKPGDVVHSIASAADIPGSIIGAITIKPHHTWFDVPANRVEKVLASASKGKIRGKPMNVERA